MPVKRLLNFNIEVHHLPSSSYLDGDDWQAINRFMDWYVDTNHVDPVVAMIDHYVGFYANDERYRQNTY